MGRQHPLDVFRSSRDGFDKASKRRTVAGKVIASSVKVTGKRSGSPASSGRSMPKSSQTSQTSRSSTAGSTARGASAKPSASRGARLARGAKLFDSAPGGGKQRSGAARTADGTTRTLFFGAIFMLSAVVLVVVFKQFWLSEPSDGILEIPTMKLGDVLPDGPGRALEPSSDQTASLAETPEWFTIRAAIYNGSERGLELATAAHKELVLRGLPEVTLIGHESDDPDSEIAQAGGFESYELIVGAARTRQALEGSLDRLLAINDWAGGKSAPFVDASIVGHPMPKELEAGS